MQVYGKRADGSFPVWSYALWWPWIVHSLFFTAAFVLGQWAAQGLPWVSELIDGKLYMGAFPVPGVVGVLLPLCVAVLCHMNRGFFLGGYVMRTKVHFGVAASRAKLRSSSGGLRACARQQRLEAYPSLQAPPSARSTALVGSALSSVSPRTFHLYVVNRCRATHVCWT